MQHPRPALAASHGVDGDGHDFVRPDALGDEGQKPGVSGVYARKSGGFDSAADGTGRGWGAALRFGAFGVGWGASGGLGRRHGCRGRQGRPRRSLFVFYWVLAIGYWEHCLRIAFAMRSHRFL